MTKRCPLLAAWALIPACLHGQFTLTREQMIAYTSKNPFERFADGRPKVPDNLLERVKSLVIEEAYGADGFWDRLPRMQTPAARPPRTSTSRSGSRRRKSGSRKTGNRGPKTGLGGRRCR